MVAGKTVLAGWIMLISWRRLGQEGCFVGLINRNRTELRKGGLLGRIFGAPLVYVEIHRPALAHPALWICRPKVDVLWASLQTPSPKVAFLG